jgi:hypothetical protein
MRTQNRLLKLASSWLLCLLLLSCDKITPPLEVREKTDEELVNQICAKVSRKLNKDKNLRAVGSGAQMMDEIKMIALSFHYYQPLTEEMARELVIAAVDELVSAVNQNEEIRKYLYKYPFQAKNVEIRIFFFQPNGNNIPFGDLSLVSSMEGKVCYKAEQSKMALFHSILIESYDEAVAKLELNKTNSNAFEHEAI